MKSQQISFGLDRTPSTDQNYSLQTITQTCSQVIRESRNRSALWLLTVVRYTKNTLTYLLTYSLAC